MSGHLFFMLVFIVTMVFIQHEDTPVTSLCVLPSSIEEIFIVFRYVEKALKIIDLPV